MSDPLSRLVSELPEIYQPIFEHPELSDDTSRSCVDRLAGIVAVHDALRTVLARPLRVLDLGCAQGFFALSLAGRGAIVHGVDYLDKNIAVCDVLAKAHPGFHASFSLDRIERVVERLERDQYDLVLGLSVFHHVTFDRNVDGTQALLAHIARNSAVLLVELALPIEPLYWASAQPQDPRTLLDDCAFVHELGRFDTHLSPVSRPVYVASNRYWILDGRAGPFDTWTTEPHAVANGAHMGTRRYFFSSEYVVKLFRLDQQFGQRNREEILREAGFLARPPKDFPAPTCLLSGTNDAEGWLAMERKPGRLLLEVLREGGKIDPMAIIRSVLQQLTALESAGLYHDDIRVWNILVTDEGMVSLIDYGSIGPIPMDCVWPNNIYLAFLIFVSEVVTGTVDDPNPLRTIAISPNRLDEPYRTWAKALWKHPPQEWSFGRMLDLLQRLPVMQADIDDDAALDLWGAAIEGALQAEKLFTQHLNARMNAILETQITWLQKQVDQSRGDLSAAEIRCQTQRERAAAAEEKAVEAERRTTDAEKRTAEAEKRTAHALTQVNDVENRAIQAEDLAKMFESLASSAETKTATTEARLAETQSALDAVSAANSLHWQIAEDRGRQLQAIAASYSWRLTLPMRWLVGRALSGLSNVRRALNEMLRLTICHMQQPLAVLMRFVLRRQALAAKLTRLLMRYPPLYQQLVGTAMRAGLSNTASPQVAPIAHRPGTTAELSAIHLGPRGRRIHADLVAAIEHRQTKVPE